MTVLQTAQQAGIRRLYHYEGFKSSFLSDTLANNRIHISNIDNINDPWDCRPWFDKDLSDPGRRREWAAFFEPMVELRTQEQREAMAKLNPPWNDNQGFLANSIDALIASVVENNIQRWRLYCLTPYPDSILMWSHYANKHAGICLEFDASGDVFGNAKSVVYRNDFQIITPALLGDPTMLTEIILLAKSQHWSYETEYRLLLRDRKLDPTFSLTCEDDSLDLPVRALTAVIAGANYSNADLEEIRALAKNHAPHIVVKRAIRKPHRYDIAITP